MILIEWIQWHSACKIFSIQKIVAIWLAWIFSIKPNSCYSASRILSLPMYQIFGDQAKSLFGVPLKYVHELDKIIFSFLKFSFSKIKIFSNNW